MHLPKSAYAYCGILAAHVQQRMCRTVDMQRLCSASYTAADFVTDLRFSGFEFLTLLSLKSINSQH